MEKETKKILLINNAYPTKNYPKRGNYIKAIEDCLLEAGLIVDRLVLNSDYNSKLQKAYAYFNFYLRILVFKKYGQYDYVYIHHFATYFIPLTIHLRRIKRVVINFHGGDIIPTSFMAKAANIMSYKLMLPSYTYIAPSEYFKTKVKETISKLRNSTFIVSPSGGVDTKLFCPQSDYKTSNKKTSVGFASGMDYNKGVEDLIYVIKKYRSNNIEFHIINFGKHQEKYLDQIKSFHNVVMHGTYKKTEMPKFYAKIDVLFFPTKSESLGLVGLEAMSCGVPVIGPDDFALKKFIVPGISGEKYNSSIKHAYTEAMENFLTKKGSYEPTSIIKRSYSKEYVVTQFKSIFS